ncbi:MAG: hypothetical protein R3F17_10650 [Planctomycetota bacterium]
MDAVRLARNGRQRLQQSTTEASLRLFDYRWASLLRQPLRPLQTLAFFLPWSLLLLRAPGLRSSADAVRRPASDGSPGLSCWAHVRSCSSSPPSSRGTTCPSPHRSAYSRGPRDRRRGLERGRPLPTPSPAVGRSCSACLPSP